MYQACMWLFIKTPIFVSSTCFLVQCTVQCYGSIIIINTVHYLEQNLPVSKYSVLLQQSLETDIFTDIITILLNDYAANGISSMAELEALTRVKRFTVAVMFLSSADRKSESNQPMMQYYPLLQLVDLESLFTALRSLPTEDNEEIDLLAKKFGL